MTQPVDWGRLPRFRREQREVNEAIAAAAAERFRWRLVRAAWSVRESWRAYRCYENNRLGWSWIAQPCQCGWHRARYSTHASNSR